MLRTFKKGRTAEGDCRYEVAGGGAAFCFRSSNQITYAINSGEVYIYEY